MRGFTRIELLELPTIVDLVTAGRALGIGRSTAYTLARRGEFPVRVLRAGASYRVATADIMRLLGVEIPQDNIEPSDAPHDGGITT